MKIYLILLILILSYFSCQAQNLNVLNQYSIGGSLYDGLLMNKSPMNDGYYFIGSSNSNISGNKTEDSRGGYDIWIVKTDNNFNVLWDKTIGGSMDDDVTAAIITGNKIYITANSQSNISGEKISDNYGSYDIWMLCLDLNGAILWQNQFGGTDFDAYSSLIDYKSNSLLIASTSNSPISGNKTVVPYGYSDNWLLEIDKLNGQILTQKNVGSNDNEVSPKLLKHSTNNHVYIACTSTWVGVGPTFSGDKTDPGYGNEDAWIIEMDENLNIIQDKCFGGDITDYFPLMVEINNNIFLTMGSNSDVSGNKTSPAQDPGGGTLMDGWVLKLDLNLNILWDKTYGGTAEEYVGPIYANSNGNLILSFSSQSIPSGNKTSPRYGMSFDAWVVITDPNGNILTQQTYGGTEDDYASFLPFPNSSNELLMVGSSSSGISGNKTVASYGGSDCWIVKIDASNFLNTEILTGSEGTISVYPNPFVDQVNFDLINLTEDVKLQIYSIDGKLISEMDIQKGTSSVNWKIPNNGEIYLYKILGNSINHSGKIIKQ